MLLFTKDGIEAIQLTAFNIDNKDEIEKFFGDFEGYGFDCDGGVLIETLDGVMRA